MKLKDFLKLLEQVDQSELQAFADHVKQQFGLEEFDLRALKDNTIDLETIIVPRKLRKAGIGSKALEELCHYADQRGLRIILQTADKKQADWGTTSKNRLIRFYKRFGFVHNSGRYKDFTLSIYKNMYRNPKIRK